MMGLGMMPRWHVVDGGEDGRLAGVLDMASLCRMSCHQSWTAAIIHHSTLCASTAHKTHLRLPHTPSHFPPPGCAAGLRRRGVSPTAINNFCREVGITRNENVIPMHRLEHYIRQDLDANSPRALAVLRPLKVGAGHVCVCVGPCSCLRVYFCVGVCRHA